MHDDMTEMLANAGIDRSVIFEGPRKTERLPWQALTAEARAAVQANVRDSYERFTADVAKFRRVSVSTVRADPEKSDAHFGGGRMYHAKEAVRLGMADRVGTFEDTINRVARARKPRSVAMERARLAMR